MMEPIEAYRHNKARWGAPPKPRRKFSYLGVPAAFRLDLACAHLYQAFCMPADYGGIYLVGSVIERPDFRDVDVVCILDDKAFAALFPDVHDPAGTHAYFEHDPRWLVMTVALSDWLTKEVGLPVDFKIHPMTFANARHDKRRNAVGLRLARNNSGKEG